jgi:hypothetical protein
LVEDTLYCLSATGLELWARTFKDTLAFRAGSFGAPWGVGRLAVYSVDGAKRIALSLGHHHWWPALIVTLSARGDRLSTFVSAGLIYQLRVIEGPDPVIVAGGVSNSKKAATVIALDGRRALGTTPERAGSDYECLNCPKGDPLRYLTIPPSEISVAVAQPYNQTIRLRILEDSIDIGTVELGPGQAGQSNAVVREVRLGLDFTPRSARYQDGWAETHRLMQARGLIRHSLEECRDAARLIEYRRGLAPVETPLPSKPGPAPGSLIPSGPASRPLLVG